MKKGIVLFFLLCPLLFVGQGKVLDTVISVKEMDLLALQSFQRFAREKNPADLKQWVRLKNKINKLYPDFNNAFTLNSDAWFIFQNGKSKYHFRSGVSWVKHALVLEPENAYWQDTYANLLYRLGKNRKAIAQQEKAVSLDPGNNIFANTLSRMKRGLPTWL